MLGAGGGIVLLEPASAEAIGFCLFFIFQGSATPVFSFPVSATKVTFSSQPPLLASCAPARGGKMCDVVVGWASPKHGVFNGEYLNRVAAAAAAE